MRLFWRRGLTPDQKHARFMIDDGIEHRDPTPWGLYAGSAGYSEPELKRKFAAYLRSFASDSLIPEANKHDMLARAQKLENEATLPTVGKRRLRDTVGRLFLRGERI